MQPARKCDILYLGGTFMSEQKPKLPKFYLVLRIFGSLLMIAGIALIIVKAVGASGFELMVGGLACLFFGLVILVGSFAPNMQRIEIKTKRYILHENKEDLADISNQTAEVISPAVTGVARAVKEGLKEDQKFCNECGAQIDSDSKFCPNCGKSQQ